MGYGFLHRGPGMTRGRPLGPLSLVQALLLVMVWGKLPGATVRPEELKMAPGKLAAEGLKQSDKLSRYWDSVMTMVAGEGERHIRT